jgi:protein phosphatase
VDATHVRPEDRQSLIELAREYHCLPVALVFDLPEDLCHARNRERPDRDFGPHVVRHQRQQLRRSLRHLKREGFRQIHTFSTPEEIQTVEIRRVPLWTDRQGERGPFDIVGDVHGCFDELADLLEQLGYVMTERAGATLVETTYALSHPEGRKVVFLGDLVDRGPKTPQVLRLVMDAVASGAGLCVLGNHDLKLMRKLQGRDVRITHGLAESLQQLAQAPPAFLPQVVAFIDGLISHYLLDEGRLVVAHAGMPAALQGRASSKVREFALYGETTGETDEYGLPVRYNWAADYRGRARVVYGHTPVPEPDWLNRTLCIDTGCVFGGRLTALRYPEKELVSVPARQVYYPSAKPFLPQDQTQPALTAQQAHDEVLDAEDVLGKRHITTRLGQTITVPEANAAAALEVMSRFAANPKWLIYLPPTLSPSETSHEPDLLEHPAETFAYYRHQGVARVLCEEKHMGSRAVLIVCRDEEAARRRFGVEGEGIGIVYTRTGRRFFNDAALEAQLLARLRDALARAGFWEALQTSWVCLDAELLPWSAKAQALLREQYAAVGAAAGPALAAALGCLEQAQGRGAPRYRTCCSATAIGRVSAATWRLTGATAGRSTVSMTFGSPPSTCLRPRDGSISTSRTPGTWRRSPGCANTTRAFLIATAHRAVDLTDPESERQATQWWRELTERGGEGMVVKPGDFLARGRRGWVQPALKCRGREYLRIIYGPEYTAPEHLERLRSRGLATKRSLALREFALGIEALKRFVRGEPVDPRL